MLRKMLSDLIAAVDAGKKTDVVLRPIDRPRDRVFEESISKLGLLGAPMVESLVYVYGNLGGFRQALEVLSKEHGSMSDNEFKGRCVAAVAAIDRAVERGKPLLEELRGRASKRFWF